MGKPGKDELITGRLEGWRYDVMYHVLWGYLYEDVNKRWEDGQYIHTSTLQIKIDDIPTLKEGDVVHTRNSTYLLGKFFGETREL